MVNGDLDKESNNGLPETESFRRGHGGLGSRGSLSADRYSRLCGTVKLTDLVSNQRLGKSLSC